MQTRDGHDRRGGGEETDSGASAVVLLLSRDKVLCSSGTVTMAAIVCGEINRDTDRDLSVCY